MNCQLRCAHRTSVRCCVFKPKPVYPAMAKMKDDKPLYSMYMARKAWHATADDCFEIYLCQYLLVYYHTIK